MLDGDLDPRTGRSTFERTCAGPLLIVRLPPLANVRVQRTRRTNAFSAVRGDKTAMRPFAKLLWTLVVQRKFIVIESWLATY